ncbi:hypothetical protein V8073_000743 [Vibrio parahaemolyticus]
MQTKLFNDTDKPLIICNKSEIRQKIIESFDLAKKQICIRQGKSSLSNSDGKNEKARLGATKLSLFKYFDHFEDDFELNEQWFFEIYRIIGENPKDARHQYTSVLPENSRYENITLNDARGLRTDLNIFLHCCWASRFILLPVKYSGLPVVVLDGDAGKFKKEFAFEAYPEVLKIIRKPFNEDLECSVDISEHIPSQGLKNLDWYAYRYARASAAWNIEDITDELLSQVHPISNAPRTVDWYHAILAAAPERVKFQEESLFSNTNHVSGKSQKLSIDNFSHTELDQHPAIITWIRDINKFSEVIKDRGTKNHTKYQPQIRNAMATLMRHFDTLPEPHELTREHTNLIKKSLGEGVQKSTLRDRLYKVIAFFDYLEKVHKNFQNPMNPKLDIPVTPRSKGTKKKLPPEGSFPVLLSYLYGLAEWVWYMNHHNQHKDEFISKYNSASKLYDTEDSGFVPIFRHNDVYHPINKIPTSIATIQRVRTRLESQLKENTILPHYIHLTIAIAETGIRLIALRWLDEATYDKGVDRNFFNEKSYMTTKLWVNTDKSHEAWEADVSESVMGILDRQSKWKQTFLNGKDLAIPYDGHEESNFDLIRPLFATLNFDLSLSDSFITASDNNYRTKFRAILMHFSYIYHHLGEEAPVSIDENLDLIGNLGRLEQMKGEKAIPITPHSMRSQVVSDKITILPPSIIKRTTGHATDAHVIYYAQVNSSYLNAQKSAQEQEFRDLTAPMMINTKTKQSALSQAFGKDPIGAMNDFGAIAFSDNHSKTPRSGMKVISDLTQDIKDKPDGTISILDVMAFNSTHICPFNNICPDDVIEDYPIGLAPCGECSYSVKTVDNLPAISAKIRALTDKSEECEITINEAKINGEDMRGYLDTIALKQFYSREVAAWATTATCLESMAQNLSLRDKWLVTKPEFIKEQYTKLRTSNELSQVLVQVDEAISSHEFLTPQLKAKVTLLRNKILASTGQFNALLGPTPQGRTLLSDFKGVIKSICDISGIGIEQLPRQLEEINTDAQKALSHTLNLPKINAGGKNA